MQDLGAIIGLAVIGFEWRLRLVSLKRLIGAAIGSILGIIGAYLFALVIRTSIPEGHTQSFLQIMVMLLMAYVGLIVGRQQGRPAEPGSAGRNLWRREAVEEELQDSGYQRHHRRPHCRYCGDWLPRRRHRDPAVCVAGVATGGRLGRLAQAQPRAARPRHPGSALQKVASLNIQIVEDDFPSVREVDLKLIELAKLYEGKIITNDFNLNKVAQLQGVAVLNINELANSLKPIVLPGETMRVFILKEGKEYNQGVAYLDDGTMVVVDNARKMIGKTIDISVTSVLQTTAGKMIFGKWDERAAAARQEAGAPDQSGSSPANAVPNGVEVKKPQTMMVDRPVE